MHVGNLSSDFLFGPSLIILASPGGWSARNLWSPTHAGAGPLGWLVRPLLPFWRRIKGVSLLSGTGKLLLMGSVLPAMGPAGRSGALLSVPRLVLCREGARWRSGGGERGVRLPAVALGRGGCETEADSP